MCPNPDCGGYQDGRRRCASCGTKFTGQHLSSVTLTPPTQSAVLCEHVTETLITGVTAPGFDERLPRRPSDPFGRLHWVSVHGGAGESTLAALVPGSIDSGGAWPCAPDLETDEIFPTPVILVARTHVPGLLAAQTALREWASGVVQPVQMLGIVLVEDIPGRPPKVIRDLSKLVAGGAPARWRVSYFHALREGISVDSVNAPDLKRLRTEVRRLIKEFRKCKLS